MDSLVCNITYDAISCYVKWYYGDNQMYLPSTGSEFAAILSVHDIGGLTPSSATASTPSHGGTANNSGTESSSLTTPGDSLWRRRGFVILVAITRITTLVSYL